MCQLNICCAVCPSQCGVVINNNNTDVPYSLTPQDTLVLLAACTVLIITKDFPPSVLCPGMWLAYLAAGINVPCPTAQFHTSLWQVKGKYIKHQ